MTTSTAPATLEIIDLHVAVARTPVLRGVSLTIAPKELHVLLGPNGSGKSSLLAAVMGLPPFEVTSGDIRMGGRSIVELPPDARARLGLGLAFQRPPAIAGVRIADFARALGGAERLHQAAEALDLGTFEARSLAVGFSGGELKRWEVLKLALQAPKVALFDEPDSGVDLEHIHALGRAIDRLVRDPEGARAGLIITHTGLILEHVRATRGHILVDGRIVHSGDPVAAFRHIQRHGYTQPKESTC
ncbi:ABC transporter ATP-binding protein [Pseudenhygromyxa sp. WMMC2535]|uniref:ABC transporter ATP-binding protein n=1 Tax=Pseudenhygromyxa sp. WMMC2535 TaxID=2712867 RepID=UPI0015544E68|nr:ABC transporter ATP-binding protein [Pseudenhygromyxa sp. WMMC2535]NVB41155.1 ABC transporter ATP-binding protein [Pseudenhygromyxa sp. WMMC2535]